jgi:ribonucleotide monophosphatase NagD (HAD superfamily)
VLAIGDGMKTDIVGARQAGLDALFVTGGIHRSLHKQGLTFPADPVELRRLCDENDVSPVAAISVLRP